MTKAMLIDITKCLGCNACTQACKMANAVPEGVYRTTIHEVEDGAYPAVTMNFVKTSCKHCVSPACASACPVGALRKSDEGPVIYDSTRCIGCRYCMNACPFDIPTFRWDKGLLEQPVIDKCTFCVDRVDGSEGPACAEACPFGAITYGDRDELLLEAHQRIADHPDRYIDQVYGEHEVGGTSLLYLANVPFETLGLPALGPEPVTAKSEAVMKGTLPFAFAWGAVLTGTWGFFTWRENRKQRIESAHQMQEVQEDKEKEL